MGRLAGEGVVNEDDFLNGFEATKTGVGDVFCNTSTVFFSLWV